MHEVGDKLMAEYFLDPVMDMEWLTVHYSSLIDLLRGLKKQGVRNINSARNKGLTGKGARKGFDAAYQHYCTPEGKYPLTYEVVYGHAWKGMKRRSDKGTEVFVPVPSIVRK